VRLQQLERRHITLSS